jgi:hypothetical protein
MQLGSIVRGAVGAGYYMFSVADPITLSLTLAGEGGWRSAPREGRIVTVYGLPGICSLSSSPVLLPSRCALAASFHSGDADRGWNVKEDTDDGSSL